MSKAMTTDHAPPLLLNITQVAEALGVARASVRRYHDAGRLPKAVHIGRSCRWRAAEIEDWIIAGCPPRCEWRWPKRT